MTDTELHVRGFSGEKLRDRRLAIKADTGGRKGSQSWLAEAISAHVTSVSDWERGANVPSPRHLSALAQALGCDIDDLFAVAEGGDGDGEPVPFPGVAA